MQLSRYVVDAVVLEGRSVREVASAHGISKSWVGEVVRRFRRGGYQAIEPRSRAPHHTPHRVPSTLEDEIVGLRKKLSDDGLDAGAQTIHYHLSLIHETVPAVSTIWRVLKRAGSSSRSHTNDLDRAGSVSKPPCPTNAGSPM